METVIQGVLVERNGIHHVRFRVPAPLPGRPRRTIRRSRSTGERTKAAAERAKVRILEAETAAVEGRRPSCTLRELALEWLDLNSNSVSAAHWAAMERHVRLHFGALLDLDLKEITTERVKEALNQFKEDHGPRSALAWRRYLRRLFGWAMDSQRLRFLPWSQKALGKMKAPQMARPILPAARWRPFLAALDDAAGCPGNPWADYRCMAVRLLFACALRESEAVRARWEWLDLERGTYTPGNLPGGEARTKGGEAQPRAMPGWMLDLLRPQARPSGWMFPDPKTGRPGGRGCCRRLLQAAAKAAGCPGITHHRIRATVATLMQRHASVRDAQQVLAHKDPGTTMIYSEQDPAAPRQALEAIAQEAGLAVK